LQAQEKAQEMEIAPMPKRQLVGRPQKQLQATFDFKKGNKKESTNNAKSSKSYIQKKT
jgi:hypothetical protein